MRRKPTHFNQDRQAQVCAQIQKGIHLQIDVLDLHPRWPASHGGLLDLNVDSVSSALKGLSLVLHFY